MHVPFEQRIIALLFSLTLLLVTIQLIRKRKLREEYALVWLAASTGILLFSVFTGLVTSLAASLAVTYAPTLVIVLGLLFALVVLLSHSAALSEQANRVRDLTQTVALLEWRLQQVESADQQPASTPPAEKPQPPPANNGRSKSGTSQPASSKKGVSRPSRPQKVVVIGLDGATFDLIKPWAAQGHLPTLARLLAEGAHGELASTLPPMTAPAWTSFATGVNPGKHRLYDWITREPDSYRFRPVTALDGASPTLFSLLSQAGRRICALNIPMTYPPLAVNGVLVSGMPAPSTNTTISHPEHLFQEIIDAVGDYILYPDPGQAYSDSGIDAFLERLYRCADLRVRTFDFLRRRDDWDFTMMVFNGTDTVSHAMWKFMDSTHPLHNPAKAKKYGSAIRDYYRHVDSHLAHIISSLDEDTNLILMSDHGFGPFHKFIHVNNWLIEQGFMNIKDDVRVRLKAALFRRGFSPMNVYNTLMRLGLGALKREVVRGQGQGLLKTLFLSFEDVDWSRTTAYSLGNVGQIRLNVAGREPQGIIQPGKEYDQARAQIMARLETLRDPQTGEKVVETVYRREEIYHGPALEEAADIIFIPRRLEYFGFGEYEFGSHQVIEEMQRGISGTHRLNGIFLAHGPAIKAGAQPQSASLVDLAPTILHILGEPLPAHMDGRPMKEILADDFIPQRPDVQAVPEGVSGPSDGQGLSPEEQEILSRRLRDLGYVG